MEFRAPEGSERWIADRVETLRPDYQRKLAAHRARDRGGRAPDRLVVPGASHRPPGIGAAAHAHHAAAGHGRRLPLEAADAAPAGGGTRMTLGPIAFLSPWLLAGLLALPVIWWLLRTDSAAAPAHRVPADPHPGRHREPREDAGADALVADADPHAGRRAGDPGAGRAGAQSQPREGADGLRPRRAGGRQRLGRRGAVVGAHLHDRAADRGSRRPEPAGDDRADRQRDQEPSACKVEAPAAARSTAAAMQPQPFCARPHGDGAGDRQRPRRRRRGLVVWLADGIDHDGSTRAISPTGSPASPAAGLSVVETRPGPGGAGRRRRRGNRRTPRRAGAASPRAGPRVGTLHAMSARGQRLGEAPFTLGDGETRALATFDLPLELRNQVTRVEIARRALGGCRAPARCPLAVAPRRPRSGASREQAQPLLAPLYYIERALAALLGDRQERRCQPARPRSTA